MAVAEAGSVLNLRDAGGLALPINTPTPAPSPFVTPASPGRHSRHQSAPGLDLENRPNVLHSNLSSTSMYGLDTAHSESSATAKVSLHDLRTDLKAALATTDDGSGSVVVTRDMLQRMLQVMRENLAHNIIQRTLRKDARVATAKLADIQRENARLQERLSTATGVPPLKAINEYPSLELVTSTEPSVGPSTPAATTNRVGIDSGDGGSFMGDEVDTARGKNQSDELRRALRALANERKRKQQLEDIVHTLRDELQQSHRGPVSARSNSFSESGGGMPVPQVQRSGWSMANMGILAMLQQGFVTNETSPPRRERSTTLVDTVVEEENGSLELMHELATTKVTLAETEGELTAARRDVARIQAELGNLKEALSEMADDREKAWEEVGALMVQIHQLEGEEGKEGEQGNDGEEIEEAVAPGGSGNVSPMSR